MSNPYYNYSNNIIGDKNDDTLGTRASHLNEILTISDIRNEGGNQVHFIAFVNSFSQTFNSTWNTQEALGRMDDIATFQKTTRNISVTWDIPAADKQTAKENLNRCNALISMLYPSYTKSGTSDGGSYIMSKPPLVRVKYANLIANTNGTKGLKGYISSLSWTPVLEMGSYHHHDGIYPKVITISIEFTALHEPIGKGGPTGYFEGASGLRGSSGYTDEPAGTKRGWPFKMDGENNRRLPPVMPPTKENADIDTSDLNEEPDPDEPEETRRERRQRERRERRGES